MTNGSRERPVGGSLRCPAPREPTPRKRSRLVRGAADEKPPAVRLGQLVFGGHAPWRTSRRHGAAAFAIVRPSTHTRGFPCA
jgi:hypothetical protein